MIEPSGQTFDQEITVTIPYDPSVDPDRIDVFWWNAKIQSLEKITAGKTIDRKNHTISVRVTHFTTFAVLSAPVPTGYNTYWLIFTAVSVVAGCLYLFFRRRKRLVSGQV
jgi:LPXTG-motif cell wall-anchored protein